MQKYDFFLICAIIMSIFLHKDCNIGFYGAEEETCTGFGADFVEKCTKFGANFDKDNREQPRMSKNEGCLECPKMVFRTIFCV